MSFSNKPIKLSFLSDSTLLQDIREPMFSRNKNLTHCWDLPACKLQYFEICWQSVNPGWLWCKLRAWCQFLHKIGGKDSFLSFLPYQRCWNNLWYKLIELEAPIFSICFWQRLIILHNMSTSSHFGDRKVRDKQTRWELTVGTININCFIVCILINWMDFNRSINY